MEFDESDFRPNSNRSELYRQVLEQSDICDITIQVGKWKKQFHWCVLVISPFFESLRKNSFIETNTGIIKLNVASPLDTETAILFLYGQKPKFTESNVSAILELSESLMIPILKSSCVKYIKTMNITTENCIQLLELSCLYEFDLTKSNDYIRCHLDDVLPREEASHLTKESVIELFTDPHLSYVSSQVRFSYLVNWAKHCRKNESAFSEVFDCIDLEEMDSAFLEREVFPHPLVPDDCKTTYCDVASDEHRVLIFSNSKQQNRITCFDIDKDKWCGIETSLPDGSNDGRTLDINGVCNFTLPEIYIVANSYSSCAVSKYNIQTKHTSLVEVSAHGLHGSFDCFYTDGDSFIGVTHESTLIERKANVIESSPLGRNQRGIISGLAHIYDSQALLRYFTLYYGHLDTPNTDIDPVVTIKGTQITSCCINTDQLAGLLSEKEKALYIYDIANCSIDTIQLEPYINFIDNYCLMSSDKGFVVHNNKQVFIVDRVSRLYGPALAEKYVVQSVDLEYDKAWNMAKYFYCATDKLWFRLVRKDQWNTFEFASVSHEELMRKNCHDLAWTPLSLTDELKQLSFGHHAFITRIHRSLLRCHPSCPHCERFKVASVPLTTTYFYTDEDKYYIYNELEDDYDYNEPEDDYGGYANESSDEYEYHYWSD